MDDLLNAFLASIRSQTEDKTLMPYQERTVQDMVAPEELFSKALFRLPQKQQEDLIDTVLKNLRLNINYDDFANEYVSGKAFGGRVGYNLPLEDKKDLEFGIRGQGVSVDTPVGKFKQSDITGGDVSYRFGPNRIGLQYDKYGVLPSQIAPPSEFEQPLKNLLQLIYRREF